MRAHTISSQRVGPAANVRTMIPVLGLGQSYDPIVQLKAKSDRMTDDSINGADNGSIRRPPTMRWRWYHFYFVLALFDLVVIVSSLGLYHSIRVSYQVALEQLSHLELQEQWITGLRLAVYELNAPGNDVFETRDVEAERRRFERSRSRLEGQLDLESDFGIGLGQFRTQVDAMIVQEEMIFSAFASLGAEDMNPADKQGVQDGASVAMASMDRSQVRAMQALHEVEQSLHSREVELLRGYELKLARSEALERIFVGAVVFILVGVFWYGRKLQHTHEQMILDRERMLEERHARLAAVGEVCSTVAHGIRNPLAAITSSAQLALEFGTLDETTKLRIRDVLGESRRLDRRVTRLLDFSRPPTRVFEPYDLRGAVEQAVHELGIRLKESNVNVRMELDPAPVLVHGDQERLVQSVIELLSNSLDNLPGGGNVRITCTKNPKRSNHAVLSVADDGPGIPERLLPRIFDLFVTSKSDGHGIGLASVKRAVELHGGSIEVMPTEGKGAHLRIQLPLA